MRVFGKNVIKELMKSKATFQKIYISKNFNDEEILSQLINYKYEKLEAHQLDKLIKEAHQGIIADIQDDFLVDVEELISDNPNDLIVMLDHLEDPHNLGAIIRTCEASGVKGIIIPENRSVDVNNTVMKVSAGALAYVKIAKVTNLKQTLDKLKKYNYFVVGTDADGTNYKQIDYRGKIVLVIGSEGHGMSDLIKKNCDFIASLPMNGKVNSLNASVAAGIMIYEVSQGQVNVSRG